MQTHGIEVLIPDADERALVHDVIFRELVHGVINGASREAFRGVVKRLVERGAQGIVLGCTEIELLIAQSDSPVAVFPTAAIHVTAAVDAALETAPRERGQ
jgi:aspartate racemase